MDAVAASEHRIQQGVLAVALLALIAAAITWAAGAAEATRIVLLTGLVLGGVPLVLGLVRDAFRGEFGADFLAAVSIVTAAIMGEYVAGLIVVTMLSGGELLESLALGRASAALRTLAERMPSVAHVDDGGALRDVPVDSVAPGDELVVLPHELVPVDGVVVEGHTRMNEAYLTGEPWDIDKAPGSTVISGAVNGDGRVLFRATRPAATSRYARILDVLRDSEQRRPAMRRLGDRLGGAWTPVALAIAGAAWAISGDPQRFLAVLVVATPCPLLIAIPVAVLGVVSQAARRGIVIRDPGILERLGTCRTLILDKTGTLTAGRPTLLERIPVDDGEPGTLLARVASLERYSRHPLAHAIVEYADGAGLPILPVERLSEAPGQGLVGTVDGVRVSLTNRARAAAYPGGDRLPPVAPGLECVVLADDRVAAVYRFHDAPRADGAPFIHHLGPAHALDRVMIVSGDRDAEVRAVAAALSIDVVHAECSPEDKVRIVAEETAKAPTLFVGDGMNDAPALARATAGVAFGRANEVSVEAADAVVLDPSLRSLDELLHLGAHLRRIALQSAVGGMALSTAGMLLAAFGLLTPVAGALAQEAIDLASIANALRALRPPRHRSDF